MCDKIHTAEDDVPFEGFKKQAIPQWCPELPDASAGIKWTKLMEIRIPFRIRKKNPEKNDILQLLISAPSESVDLKSASLLLRILKQNGQEETGIMIRLKMDELNLLLETLRKSRETKERAFFNGDGRIFTIDPQKPTVSWGKPSFKLTLTEVGVLKNSCMFIDDDAAAMMMGYVSFILFIISTGKKVFKNFNPTNIFIGFLAFCIRFHVGKDHQVIRKYLHDNIDYLKELWERISTLMGFLKWPASQEHILSYMEAAIGYINLDELPFKFPTSYMRCLSFIEAHPANPATGVPPVSEATIPTTDSPQEPDEVPTTTAPAPKKIKKNKAKQTAD